MSETGPVVVATAMALDASARARLSELLGPGFLVVDIRTAPTTSNIVVAPHVSDMALAHLRGMFPRARILFSEVFDPELGIDHRGPVYAALASDADGYLVAANLDALSQEVANQASLQLTGSRARTPLHLPQDTTASPETTPERESGPAAGPTVWWLNGPSGVGTTVAADLARARDLHVFDPDEVGRMLRRVIPQPPEDIESLPAWRALVGETVVQLVEHHRADVVCPVTLLDEAWAREVFLWVDLTGIRQRHVLLHADPGVLRERIGADRGEPGTTQRRLRAVDRYVAARCWLAGVTDQVDTTRLSADQVLHAVERLMSAG